MNNGIVKEQRAIFEKPDAGMMYHLKSLLIRVEVDNIGLNKMFVDRGEAVNMMHHSLLKNIGKYDTDLRPYYMVLSNGGKDKSYFGCNSS